jgi:hypothetical protein
MRYSTNGGHKTIINLNKVSYINLEKNKLIFFFLEGNTKKEIEYINEAHAQVQFDIINEIMGNG